MAKDTPKTQYKLASKESPEINRVALELALFFKAICWTYVGDGGRTEQTYTSHDTHRQISKAVQEVLDQGKGTENSPGRLVVRWENDGTKHGVVRILVYLGEFKPSPNKDD